MTATARIALAGLAMTVGAALVAPPAHAMNMDDAIYSHLEAEELEYRLDNRGNIVAWDVHGWIGNDDHRLAFKSEGEYPVEHELEVAEFQFLYRRPISDFFDFNIGVRHDVRPLPMRTYGVIGIEGLADQFVETDVNLFVSETGDVSVRVEAEVEWLLTQRVFVKPSFEMHAAFSEDARIESGAGINDIELGLRLHYQIRREIAPYIGIHWERKFGETAGHAREEGESTSTLFAVIGLQIWF